MKLSILEIIDCGMVFSPIKKCGRSDARCDLSDIVSPINRRSRASQKAMRSEVTTTNDTSKHKCIVEEQWRTVLRQEKLESLRKELRLLQDYHEQDLAHKHATLARLESEFGTAEDQYRSTHAVHVQRLRQLVDLYEERLLSMEADFQGKHEHLQQEYTSEREAIVTQHDGNRQVMLGQIEALKTQENLLEPPMFYPPGNRSVAWKP